MLLLSTYQFGLKSQNNKLRCVQRVSMTTNNQTFSSYTTYLNMSKVKPQSKQNIKIKEKRNEHINTCLPNLVQEWATFGGEKISSIHCQWFIRKRYRELHEINFNKIFESKLNFYYFPTLFPWTRELPSDQEIYLLVLWPTCLFLVPPLPSRLRLCLVARWKHPDVLPIHEKWFQHVWFQPTPCRRRTFSSPKSILRQAALHNFLKSSLSNMKVHNIICLFYPWSCHFLSRTF